MTPAAALSGANGVPCRRAERSPDGPHLASGSPHRRSMRLSKLLLTDLGLPFCTMPLAADREEGVLGQAGGRRGDCSLGTHPSSFFEMVLPRNSHPDRASSFCEMVRASNRHPHRREFVLRNGARGQQASGPAGVRFSKWCIEFENTNPLQVPRRQTADAMAPKLARRPLARSQPAASRAGRSPIIIAPERARTTHKHIKSCCGKRRTADEGRQRTDDRRRTTESLEVKLALRGSQTPRRRP
jgi:hypothetical protein